VARAAVRARWDTLVLKSRCKDVVLQEDSVARIMSALYSKDQLTALVTQHDGDAGDGRILFSGNAPAFARPSKTDTRIQLQLPDPVTGNRLEHRCTVHVLSEIFPATA
jgi:hypothetical protein